MSFGLGLTCLAIAVVATIQMVIALFPRHEHDPPELRTLLLGLL